MSNERLAVIHVAVVKYALPSSQLNLSAERLNHMHTEKRFISLGQALQINLKNQIGKIQYAMFCFYPRFHFLSAISVEELVA